MLHTPLHKPGHLDTLGWAFYVACSWTWCIGMFLPVLLVRDVGVWGFVAFAVPNIIGAASIGWQMRSPERSRQLLVEHRAMVWLFSAVTIAFQTYFAAWLWTRMAPAWIVAPIVAILLCIIPGFVNRMWLVTAGVVWAVSAIVIGKSTSLTLPVDLPSTSLLPGHEVWPLAMVCTLGFLACPFLDSTFHRARIESADRSKLAFGAGFGLFFAAMICGTLLAFPLLLPLTLTGKVFSASAAVLLALHVIPQLLFTIRVHAMESRSIAGRFGFALVAGLALLAVFFLKPLDAIALPASGLTLGEVAYRVFMSFYGLVFPAYALIVMSPVTLRTGRRLSTPTRSRLLWCFASIVLAMPFYWVSFIERQTWWVLPGIVIIFAARIGARTSSRRSLL